jgi:hypothetical protein
VLDGHQPVVVGRSCHMNLRRDNSAPRIVMTEGPVSIAIEVLRDAFGLVVNLERDLLQLVGVLAAVVGAEQQLEAVGHGDADVGLCPAPIAPISGVQCGAFDD